MAFVRPTKHSLHYDLLCFHQVDTKKHGMIDVLGCSEPVEEGQTVFLRYWKSPEDDVSIHIMHECIKETQVVLGGAVFRGAFPL